MDRPFPRLHVVTDTRPGRDPLAVVRAAVNTAASRAALGAGGAASTAAAGRAAVGAGGAASTAGHSGAVPGDVAGGGTVHGGSAAGDLAVQVRVEDHFTDRQAYELTVAVLELCRPAGVPCLVNDRLQVALAAGADGCHVGADDLPVAAARRVLDACAPHRPRAAGAAIVTAGAAQSAAMKTGASCAPGAGGETDAGWASGAGVATGTGRAVLGATCRTPQAALTAVADGATYLGVGPAFGTSTKRGLPHPIGPPGIRAVARAVPLVPVIAIGGVTANAVGPLLAAGAHGVAVVGALSSAADPARAAAELLDALAAVAGRGPAR